MQASVTFIYFIETNSVMKKKQRNGRFNILILVIVFVMATVFFIMNTIEESNPRGQFTLIEENQTVETAKQATINLGIAVISAIIIVGIGIHFLVKFTEKMLKNLI